MKRVMAAAATMGLIASFGVAPMALAKGGGSRAVSAAGTCSGSAVAKIKAKNDNSRIEVEFEVDQNRNGVSWTWAIARNGKTVRTGTSVTKAPSGSFSVNRLIGNPAGSDRISFRASNARGQVCTGKVTV